MESPFLFHTLPNGLQIIGQQSKTRKSAALGFFVKTGSRDEVGAESGVSHFLEHMLFKGTPKRSALELTFDMGNIGAQSNAFTSEENTVYYGAVLPEYVSSLQEILSDMMRPALRQEDFDTEKQVILEEIALYQDRPHFFLFENASKDFFGAHPAGNSVLGSTESIKALTSSTMRDYFNRRYSPGNVALVAAGNFDWKAFVSDAERLCGSWSPVETPRSTPRHAAQVMRKEYRKKKLHQTHVLFMTDGASAQDPERFSLGLLSTMLGDSSGSKLYWALIDSGLADGAGADTEERDGTGAFSAYASTEPDKLEKVASVVQEILSKPLDFSPEDLERARTKVITRMVQSNELPMGQLMALGLEWNARREVETLQESIDQYKKVSRSSIEAALEKFPLTTWSEFRLLPE
jgi:predicted Zn-dependent peptidase